MSWNKEPLIIHREYKWHEIVAFEIGCSLNLVVDSQLPGKEVNRSITIRVEV